MAIDLKKTDVVIVGLGAVGGVAALPLARAGLEVDRSRGGRLADAADFAPDELRNNFRGWPQAVQKANQEIPTHRPNASAPYSPRAAIHPMMNAVGGTTLHYWAQSWRLNPWDFKVVSETTRRYGPSRIPKGRPLRIGRSASKSSSPTTRKWSTSSACREGRKRQRKDRSARQHLRGAAEARVSDASAARHRVHRDDGGGGAEARVAPVPRTRGHQLPALPESGGLRVSRLLQPGRLPRQRERFNGRHDDSQGAGHGTPHGRHAGARHRH